MSLAAVLAILDPGRLQQLQREALSQIAAVVEANSKRVTPVRTGNLRRSIHGEVQGVSRAVVGTNVIYAPVVHRRRPFLDQGLQMSLGDVDGVLARLGQRFVAAV